MGHIGEKLISGASWTIMLLAASLTDGEKRNIIFIAGLIAAALKGINELYGIYLKRKEHKKYYDNEK